MESTPSASYSLTLRVKLASRTGTLGELTTAIGRAGGDIGAIDIVSVGARLDHPRHLRQRPLERARRRDRRGRRAT